MNVADAAPPIQSLISSGRPVDPRALADTGTELSALQATG